MSALFDRTMMSVSGTPGTGTITLGSAITNATNGDQLSFANAGVPDQATVSYVAIDGNNWGKGRGVYTASGMTLSRDVVEVTWNGSTVGSTPISLSSAAVVFLTSLATDLPQLVETHTASSSAALNFTTWSAVAASIYRIELINILPATNNTDLLLEMSTNGGSSYDQTAGHYSWAMFENWTGTTNNGSGSATQIALTGGYADVSNVASNGGVSGEIKFYNPSSAAMNKQLIIQQNHYANSVSMAVYGHGGGQYLQTAAVNAFRIRAASGNITSGTARVTALPSG